MPKHDLTTIIVEIKFTINNYSNSMLLVKIEILWKFLNSIIMIGK